jgi:hypothetical protein
MKNPFKLKQVKPGIFLLEFTDEYDMCMFFLRYQEYYESSSAKFRNKTWKIFDFMRWYSKAFGRGAFTYPVDWAGFNIPDYVIRNVRKLGIPDPNDYDKAMWSVYQDCKKKSKRGKFYIIGVVKGNGALEHEIAHGLFYLNLDYRKASTKLVKEMDPALRAEMEAYLHNVGYTPQVYIDETQANMATTDDFEHYSERQRFEPDVAKKLVEAQKPFIELFKKFTNEKANY